MCSIYHFQNKTLPTTVFTHTLRTIIYLQRSLFKNITDDGRGVTKTRNGKRNGKQRNGKRNETENEMKVSKENKT